MSLPFISEILQRNRIQIYTKTNRLTNLCNKHTIVPFTYLNENYKKFNKYIYIYL